MRQKMIGFGAAVASDGPYAMERFSMRINPVITNSNGFTSREQQSYLTETKKLSFCHISLLRSAEIKLQSSALQFEQRSFEWAGY